MPIYTKKGDKGNTSTFKGAMSKSDQLAVALGAIDELNSYLGVCEFIERKNIQTNLLTIGSNLAGSKLKLKSGETKKLEKLIDRLTAQMPEIKNFIYPTGHLHVARAVCRRAEREIVKLGVPKNILQYLNRLSDALFVLARWTNFQKGVVEEVWKP